MERVYLNIPYNEKEYAKTLGQIYWDADAKKWWCLDSDKDRFEKYLPFSSLTYQDLSEEQKFSIDVAKKGQNILIDACIGSGKTTTIQVMCNELKNKRILYLTYNKLLKEDAQMKIISPNAVATNYDGFAYMALTRNNMPTDFERNITLFNLQKPPIDSYDVIILDEYQDIREDIAEMLLYIKEKNPGIQVIAVGDMEQKIYNFTALDIRTFIQDFLGRKHQELNFTKCFRLCKEHAEALGFLWGKDINGVNENGKFLKIHTLKDIVEFLSDKDPKDILVLGHRGGDAARILNQLEQNYPDRFNKKTVYASIRDEDGGTGNKEKSTSAIFTTFDSSKGLERKYCIVLDWTKEYWIARKSHPDTDYKILRNLFLVAASRGKEYNIFFENERKHKDLLYDFIGTPDESKDEKAIREFRNRDSLILEGFVNPYHHEKPFTASTMYDFMFREDVEKCYQMLRLKGIRKKNTEVIDVVSRDGNIDLSPCIGRYVEADFFPAYNLDDIARFIQMQNDIDFIKPKVIMGKNGEPNDYLEYDSPLATIEDKILMLTATETRQDRYVRQVDVPFISDDDKQKIKKRLKEKFNGKEEVQVDCEIDFTDKRGLSYQIHGKCDVIKDNTIYELKFTDGLKETDYLQLAFYLCANPGMKGILWNIKTNEMVKVEVRDKEKFLKQTVRAITKRNVEATNFLVYDRNQTRFTFDEVKYVDKAKQKSKSKQLDFTKEEIPKFGSMEKESDTDAFFGINWDDKYNEFLRE